MLSVIIPTAATRTDNLRLCLFGLTRQSHKDFEVIVSANGSPSLLAPIIENVRDSLDITLLCRPSLPERGTVGRNRNLGTRIAKGSHFIFIDSDVVLERRALEYYAEGFANYPNRAIAGLYHWLPPMQVTERNIVENWDDFINGRLPLTQQPPFGHNVGRDGRTDAFETTSPNRMYSDYGRCLALLSGNMGISGKCFWNAGGFWEELDFCEDGAFGLALVQAGFNVSFSSLIVGGHLYHKRHPDLQQLSERALK